MNFISKRVIYSVDDVTDIANFYRDIIAFDITLDPDFTADQWSELTARSYSSGSTR